LKEPSISDSIFRPVEQPLPPPALWTSPDPYQPCHQQALLPSNNEHSVLREELLPQNPTNGLLLMFIPSTQTMSPDMFGLFYPLRVQKRPPSNSKELNASKKNCLIPIRRNTPHFN
jgi:hypothetical protein